MNVYVVSYDLNRPRVGDAYASLFEELKKSPSWWHYLDSTWLIATRETVSQLAERIRTRIDKGDALLVMRVVGPADGWLPDAAWKWINDQQAAA